MDYYGVTVPVIEMSDLRDLEKRLDRVKTLQELDELTDLIILKVVSVFADINDILDNLKSVVTGQLYVEAYVGSIRKRNFNEMLVVFATLLEKLSSKLVVTNKTIKTQIVQNLMVYVAHVKSEERSLLRAYGIN